MELNKTHNIDCIEGMKQLHDNCIDLTVTSPPYDNLRKYNGFQWDFEGVANELYRVTKKGGVVVWVVNDSTTKGSESGTSFRQALYFMDIGFRLHDTMIYAKNNPIPLTHNRYEQQFEYMFIFSKGKPKTFNPIMRSNKNAGKSKSGTHRVDGDNLQQMNKLNLIKKQSINYNIWFYDVGNNKSTLDKIAFKHPATFPEQLVNDHIISWSNEGDLVMDCFMGSGTTAKMAIKNNRNYIGFELSKEYCEIAKERTEDIISQTKMY